jgi:hypothetical protein
VYRGGARDRSESSPGTAEQRDRERRQALAAEEGAAMREAVRQSMGQGGTSGTTFQALAAKSPAKRTLRRFAPACPLRPTSLSRGTNGTSRTGTDRAGAAPWVSAACSSSPGQSALASSVTAVGLTCAAKVSPPSPDLVFLGEPQRSKSFGFPALRLLALSVLRHGILLTFGLFAFKQRLRCLKMSHSLGSVGPGSNACGIEPLRDCPLQCVE